MRITLLVGRKNTLLVSFFSFGGGHTGYPAANRLPIKIFTQQTRKYSPRFFILTTLEFEKTLSTYA